MMWGSSALKLIGGRADTYRALSMVCFFLSSQVMVELRTIHKSLDKFTSWYVLKVQFSQKGNRLNSDVKGNFSEEGSSGAEE